MFGITNRCNLRCTFCSRDVGRPSEWSVESAHDVLAGLSAAGTLEVAFGGGEPFAFRGLTDLLVRLRDTTPLALHVTTNGTLLGDVEWSALRGALGMVRLSLYDEVDWRAAGVTLARAVHSRAITRWGANVLVDDDALAMLPRKLDELAALGAHDVSLLSYVGAGLARRLSSAGESQLGRIIEGSPLPVRLSVCLGSRVLVPRLFAGADDSGDCGAGRDFVSITPDRRVQSCSFQDASFPVESAADVLRIWSRERDALAQASARDGCARAVAAPMDGGGGPRAASVRVWQQFSGNNSGECIMVARFETAEDAEKYLAELLPGFVADEAYSAAWRELFARERVATPAIEYAESPREMLVAGRSVFALTTAADDAFPELRAFAWKRGAHVLGGGIHLHDKPTVLFVIRARPNDVDALLAAVTAKGALSDAAIALPHGDLVLGAVPAGDTLAETVAQLRAVARGAALALEIFFAPVDAATLTREAQRLGDRLSETSRMTFAFWAQTPEERATRAAAFAQAIEVDAKASCVVNSVIAEGARKRLAVLGYRSGASVHPLLATRVRVHAQLWRDAPPRTKGKRAPPPAIVQAADVERSLEPRLRAALGGQTFTLTCEAGPTWRQGVSVTIETEAPRAVYDALGSMAAEMPDVSISVGVSDSSNLAFALRRLIDEVRAASR